MSRKPQDQRLAEDRLGLRARVRAAERALLVSLQTRQARADEEEETLRELKALCHTAGVEVLRTVIQRRRRPHAATFLGKGKTEELRQLVQASGADVVIFNDELTPAQGRNLEELLGVKIIDRAQLIMDIFAQRAVTHDAKLQVELAQLEYLLPRLRGWGEALSRLGGGIGTRGPGETKLTMERRQLRARIHRIQAQLEQMKTQRAVNRQRRQRRGVPQVVLVGYTNTGKSTLLNRLTEAGVLTEDKLFATLDPVARYLRLPDGREVVLTDTVGFIRKLPKQLVPAFQSTLEAVQGADLLLHVLEAPDPGLLHKWEAIRQILEGVLGSEDWPPVLHALNKIDAVTDEEALAAVRAARGRLGHTVEISALHRFGLETLLERIAALLAPPRVELELKIPHAQGQWLDRLHRQGEVASQRYDAQHVVVRVSLDRSVWETWQPQAEADGLRWDAVDGPAGLPPVSEVKSSP